jgi:hypothetical protein
VRGGLDDALDKLARRDELRRRATGEATGTPPAVTELVESIAAVIAHHPQMGVTVGVEGAGDPLLLHFYFADGQVQVNAENAVSAPPAGSPVGQPRHADFVVEVDATVEEVPPRPAYDDHYYADSETVERRYGPFEEPSGEYAPPTEYEPSPEYPSTEHASPTEYASQSPGETSRDLGSRLRDLGMARSRADEYPDSSDPEPAQATRRIRPEQYRAPAEPSAAERIPQQPQPNGMPTPLPKPIPLQVERPEETEMAARRLAALLRDDPSLLSRPPD